ANQTQLRLEVVIVGTAMDPVVGDFRAHNEELLDVWHQRAHAWLEESGVSSWDVSIRRGATVPVLLAEARTAEMLVMGSRGHGLVFGSLSGSVSQHVARHASCPVVVVRPPRQANARQIVVGIDGSEGAQQALRFACTRASATGDPVLAVHAFRPWSLSPRIETALHTTARDVEETDRLFTDTTQKVRDDFVDVDLTTAAVAGSADRVLIDFSADASLVVVGSRGRDAFAEMLLGSVAQQVLHRAQCAVAIVR
ncbi:universal stress protein, partial [Nocardioides sp.]|uniref:universal stress protein n=1 Tax=Nocardioides sp. TaxID=35761 RepID=UPI003567E040